MLSIRFTSSRCRQGYWRSHREYWEGVRASQPPGWTLPAEYDGTPRPITRDDVVRSLLEMEAGGMRQSEPILVNRQMMRDILRWGRDDVDDDTLQQVMRNGPANMTLFGHPVVIRSPAEDNYQPGSHPAEGIQ